MAIDVLNTGTAAGSGDGESLRSAMTKVNSNFGVAENAASKIVQASSADTTADKVMLSDYAWRGAQLGDYFTYGGTANAITLTSANLRSGGTLIAGMKFRFTATTANTGSATIAVDGGAAISCVLPSGENVSAGYIFGEMEAIYNGANFVLLNKSTSFNSRLSDYTVYGGTANAITLTSAVYGQNPALVKGMKFRFEATTTNTGATTIAVDGGSAITCVTPTGAALPAGFIRTDVFTECEYDGANFVVSRKVESGSNVNGEWTKWENGRMEQEGSGDVVCSTSFSGLFGSTAGNTFFGDDVITFPVTFSSLHFVSAITLSSTSSLSVVGRNQSLSGFEPRVWAQLTGTSFIINWSAKGKWY